MKTFTFSYNKKLNGALNEIYSDLLEISDNEELSRKEVRRYFDEWKREPDYNLAQYGNLLIYYWDVREFYKRHGYKSMDRMSDQKVWKIYMSQVGYVARLLCTKKI